MLKLFYALTATAFLVSGSAVHAQQLKGFTDDHAKTQLQLERSYDQFLNAASSGATIKDLSSKPHNLGSAGSKAVAENILNRFKSFGLDAKIETYTVLFPTPKTRILEMTGPKPYKAVLKEQPLAEDATSNQPDQLPTYNAWSADGDVTGELVFVNYGLPSDYDILDKLGIDVKGKIVIAKYGRSWRGIKPKVAQEHGAIGCIIYSDPKDDGYYQGDVYPKGSFKNEYGVQRGSIMDMVIYPGDPLTPGVGATADAKRISSHNEAPNLLKIPVIPISYHDALPLLQALEGPVAPDDWRGALPFTYHIGAGPAKVHLKMEFDWKLVSCYDVVATIRGAKFPDEWVVRGNHHDAWVNGAQDPISGMAAMLEEAKALGGLVKQGWKPDRTIIYCAWDGEEPGLIGSTEWAEDHGSELQQKCVAYINSDGNGRGFLSAGGSHAFEPFVSELAGKVNDPQTNVSVLDRLNAAKVVNASSGRAKLAAMQDKDLKLGALGSGSDFSSFLQHLGVPTLDFGYGGEDNGGEYHSIFDSYDMYRRFKDPSFAYGVTLAQTAGHAVLRLADADVLPFDFRNLYQTINGYVKELMEFTDDLRQNTKADNDIVAKHLYSIAQDTADHLAAPVTKDEVPFIDFSPLQNALAALERATDETAAKWDKLMTSPSGADAFNSALYKAEQQLLLPNGLPRRGWYKHSIYAPGFYTGYGVKTMPGIREAIEQRSWVEAQEQIKADADVINKMATFLHQAAQ
ncbi:MAG TPA: transferrin receptor-like dimerization domain-containing protein [Panacibacter sp.]|nr:transferrin receptor-like dimerization domain-containing protein [Panacibacter sp.]HNP42788.1 transferrin receptor-like dimerization domain-containing protein [Panacibacter sp.]